MTRDEIIKLASQAIDDTRSAVSLPIPFVMRFAVLVAAAERAKQERQEPVGHIIFPKRRKAPDVRWADNTQIMEGAAIYAAPPVTAPVRLTDDQVERALRTKGAYESDAAYAMAKDGLLTDARAIEAASLRANGFDVQPAEAGG